MAHAQARLKEGARLHKRADGRDALFGVPSAALNDDSKEVCEARRQRMQLSMS